MKVAHLPREYVRLEMERIHEAFELGAKRDGELLKNVPISGTTADIDVTFIAAKKYWDIRVHETVKELGAIYFHEYRVLTDGRYEDELLTMYRVDLSKPNYLLPLGYEKFTLNDVFDSLENCMRRRV